jgi:hypothetical protein
MIMPFIRSLFDCKFLVHIAITMLQFIVFTIFWSTVQHIFNFPSSYYPISCLLSIATTIGLSWYFFEDSYLKKILFIAIIAAMILICCGVAIYIYDFSFDGRWYHQMAIFDLANSYNPIYKFVINFDTAIDAHYEVGLNCYPKALWIFSAALYKCFDLIEIGKIYNYLLMIADFFLGIAVLRQYKFSKELSIVISLLAVLNPVVICQMFTFCVDGALYLAILAFIELACLRFSQNISYINHKYLNIALILVLALLINIKTTGFVYAMIFCCGLCFINRNSFKVLCLGVLLGIFLGINPYLTNTVYHGNPFWPIMSKNSQINTLYELLGVHEHPDFLKRNRIITFLWGSLATARTVDVFTSDLPQEVKDQIGTPKIKIPLTTNFMELAAYRKEALRIGGFGPWFGAILIFSILSFGYFIISKYRFKTTKINRDFILLLLFLLFSTFINPGPWFARYVGQFYLIPILLAIYYYKNDNFQSASYILLTLLLVNSILVGTSNIYYTGLQNIDLTKKLQMLKEYTSSNVPPLMIDFSANYYAFRRSNIIKLEKYDIPFIEINATPNVEQKVMFLNGMAIFQ